MTQTENGVSGDVAWNGMTEVSGTVDVWRLLTDTVFAKFSAAFR